MEEEIILDLEEEEAVGRIGSVKDLNPREQLKAYLY
jgi:hypothetical protein